MKTPVVCIFISLVLIGCNPVSRVAETRTPHVSTPTAAPPFEPAPTNIQLPFDPGVTGDEYCKPPYATLPVSDGNDISEDEIVHELMGIWLRRYTQPNAPLSCRIADYAIDQVYADPGLSSLALEPRGDFMRMVDFSVKLIQVPTDWMGFAGELDQDNWLHVSHAVAITRTGEGYKMEFAYP
jgi:hypothetical protein